MRDILHAVGMVAVIVIAALCTLVQLSDVSQGFQSLNHDKSPAVSRQIDHVDVGASHRGR